MGLFFFMVDLVSGRRRLSCLIQVDYHIYLNEI